MDKEYTMSYGKDIAKGIVSIIGCDGTLGEVFNIIQNEYMCWKDIFGIYISVLNEHFGKKPPIKISKLCTNLNLNYAKYQVLYSRYYSRRFDNSKIRKYVDTSDWLLPEEGLKMCLECFLENPTFQSIDWVKEALIDKETNEWTAINEIRGKRNKLRYLIYRIGIGKYILGY